jgi:hypothetical protein
MFMDNYLRIIEFKSVSALLSDIKIKQTLLLINLMSESVSPRINNFEIKVNQLFITIIF